MSRDPAFAEVVSRQLSASLVRVERMLLMLGWEIKDLDVDATSRTGRVEFRSSSGRRVVIIADERATVIERYQEREVTKTWRDDPLQSAPSQRMGPWVEVQHMFMGRTKAPSLPVAMRDATVYMLENIPGRALDVETRRQMRLLVSGPLVDAVAPPEPSRPRPPNVRSIEGEPLSDEWLAECSSCCCGDGLDPYVPFVTSRDRDARWVSASGLIEDRRGVNREFSYAHAARR